MKIGIDCRLAGSKHAGIGRYIEELVKRVVKDTSVQWILFFEEPNQITLPVQENIRIVLAPVRHYSVTEQLRMPGIFSRENLDLLHVPHFNVPLFYNRPFLVTIHDLLWHTQSNAEATTLSPLMHAFKYRGYKMIVSHAVNAARNIIVPAITVQQELLRLFPTLPKEKVTVTYEGVDTKFHIPKDEGTRDSRILFYTGSLYPHKNVMFVVEALKQLPDYELYISSSRTVFVEKFLDSVKAMGMEHQVHHLGRLTDDKLLSWYKKSFALVQPSLSEGFGLTGIEAMATGLPVLASNIPVFAEIYKDACISFDPKQVNSFVAAVHTLETADRKKVVKKGLEVVKNYSWDTMAEETITLYENSLRVRSSE